MKDARTKILLIVAPSMAECYSTARAFDLDLGQVGAMRCVTKPYLLRSWSRGTPFIARHREFWPEKLDQALDVLTQIGQLRIANDADLQPLRGDGTNAG